MKNFSCAILLIASLFLTTQAAAKASHSVKGHVTKSGKYVSPHRATNPDKSKNNNWSKNVARTLGGTIEASNMASGGAEVVVKLPLSSLTLRERKARGS